MIDHRPYGIDDPYKRLPTERYPRDPEAGQTVQIGFVLDRDDVEASVELVVDGASTEHPAVRVGDRSWTATLPTVPAGAHAYVIRVRDASGEIARRTFDVPVGRWRRADRLVDATVEDDRVSLRLGEGDDASVRVSWTFPRSGVWTSSFALDGDASAIAGAAERGGTDRSEEAGAHPPIDVTRADGVLRVRAEGIELRLDEATLAVEASRPGSSEFAVRTSAVAEWLELPDGTAGRVRSEHDLENAEELYGLGERFVGPGLRGRTWDVRVYEEYKEQGTRTYLPVPLVVSSSAWGLWVETDAPAYLDATGDSATFTVDRPPGTRAAPRQHLMLADDPYGVTAAFIGLTGEIALPPTWAYGPWMSANPWNSQAKAEREIRRTMEEDVPATVLVLEAWSDESTFYIFNDAEYDPVGGGERLRLEDFRFGGRWPDPKRLVDECHERGIRVLLWQIPVQKRLDEPHAQHDADEAHMLERGYMIRNGDGTPYRNQGWWFTDALVLDATNPDACDWWFDKRRYLFDELDIDGMKTDGGEHLWGRDLIAHNGQTGVELVNRYAQAYVDAYHAFVRERTGGDGLTFSRAGYTGAHRSPAHWAGDENSTWSAFRASIQAGLTAGLAGVSIWGWDIGGFSGEIPTVELYVRSTQMACFCPVMQYHSELHGATENRDRTPWNIAERHGDPRALTIYRAYAQLRMRFVDYIAAEAEALAAEGRPLMRYPGLVWPEARELLMEDPDTYLFGRDLLVAPVLEKGAVTREVALPPGPWIDLWSGARFEGGRRVLAPAPLERIPVFVRADSPRAQALLDAARSFEVA